MTEQDTDLVRAIRGLTIAVWAACAALIVLLGLWIWAYTAGQRAIKRISTSEINARQGRGALRPKSDESEDFFALPLDQKISRSSVVLIAKFQPAEGRERAMITEILKKRPDVVFHYSVGDEYELLSHAVDRNLSSGDGAVAFLLGSPAELRGSYSYSQGRIGGLGDITLDQLRERVGVAGGGSHPAPPQ